MPAYNAAPAYNPETPLEYSTKGASDPYAPLAPPPDTSADEELARKLQAAELREGSLPVQQPTASTPPAYPGLPAQAMHPQPYPQPQLSPAQAIYVAPQLPPAQPQTGSMRAAEHVAVGGQPQVYQHPVRYRLRERFFCHTVESIIFSENNVPEFVTRPVMSIGGIFLLTRQTRSNSMCTALTRSARSSNKSFALECHITKSTSGAATLPPLSKNLHS